MVRNKMARMPWLFMAIALFAALGVTLADCSLALRELVCATRSRRNTICADMNERNRKGAGDGKA